MRKIAPEDDAGQVSAELAGHAIATSTHVHVLVEVASEEALPLAAVEPDIIPMPI
jgi:hypothetical protein